MRAIVTCSVEEFLDSLGARSARKVIWVLRLLEELDRVPAQYFKKIESTDGLWEVRVQQAGETFRLVGFFDGPTATCAGKRFREEVTKGAPDMKSQSRKNGGATT